MKCIRKTMFVLLAVAALLPGCAGRSAQPEPTPPPAVMPPSTVEQPQNYAEGKELLALAETEEESKQLADLYGIELVEFGSGLAVFHTEENPADVVRRGEENGWPALEVNYLVEAFG